MINNSVNCTSCLIDDHDDEIDDHDDDHDDHDYDDDDKNHNCFDNLTSSNLIIRMFMRFMIMMITRRIITRMTRIMIILMINSPLPIFLLVL